MDVHGVLNVLQLSSAQKMEKPALKTGYYCTALYVHISLPIIPIPDIPTRKS